MKLDRVLAIEFERDGPRRGVAEVDGVPHIFEAEFDHSGEGFGDTFFVSPIDATLLAQVLEDWQIRLRWEAAVQRGEVARGPVPALAHERERHEALRRAIGRRVHVDPERCRYYRAAFRARDPRLALHGFLVEWHRLEGIG